MWTFEDNINEAETEFESYSYGFIIKDKHGEVRYLCVTENDAEKLVAAFNAKPEAKKQTDNA